MKRTTSPPRWRINWTTWAITAGSLILPCSLHAESVTEIAFHHLYTHLLEALKERYATPAQSSPAPIVLTTAQCDALQKLAATFVPKLSESEIDRRTKQLTSDAVRRTRFDPTRPIHVVPKDQKAALDDLVKALKTKAPTPNESSAPSK